MRWQPATLRTFRPTRKWLQDVIGWSVMKFLAIICLAAVGSTLVVSAAQSADAKAVLSPAAVDRARLPSAAEPELRLSSMLQHGVSDWSPRATAREQSLNRERRPPQLGGRSHHMKRGGDGFNGLDRPGTASHRTCAPRWPRSCPTLTANASGRSRGLP